MEYTENGTFLSIFTYDMQFCVPIHLPYTVFDMKNVCTKKESNGSISLLFATNLSQFNNSTKSVKVEKLNKQPHHIKEMKANKCESARKPQKSSRYNKKRERGNVKKGPTSPHLIFLKHLDLINFEQSIPFN